MHLSIDNADGTGRKGEEMREFLTASSISEEECQSLFCDLEGDSKDFLDTIL